MSRGFLWSASENRLQERVFKAGVFLALLIGSVSTFALPTQVRAADCSSGSFSAGGYFFADYENVEYSPEGHPIQHLKVNYPDGRPFKLTWSYYDDECNIASVTGNQVTVSLPAGVSDWSARLVSPTRIEIWNDQNNSAISGFDIPLFPAYTSIAFGGTIDGGASTFGGRKLKINQNGQVPVFTGTLPLPSACSPGVQGSASGTSQYFFDSYEHAEYVDGLLRVHLRLKTPYNDGRTFSSGITTADANCNFTSPSASFGTFIPAYAKYYSFRMVSNTHWELWNDETNSALSCVGCSGDVPAGTPFVAWGASIDGSASTLQTTPFSPVEFSGPVYAECCSSVVFLPGIEASVLKEGTNTLWPPTLFDVDTDVGKLALNQDGTPVTPNVVVDGVINTFYSAPVYRDFITFMDNLAAVDPTTGTSTIKAWEPLAYDWRFSPEKILSDGVETPTGVVDLVEEIERLALTSDTGKVTIVAHSMGGLVGKALIKKLTDKGEGDLIDAFVMVGSPQLGTPQATTGLLNGEGSQIGGGIILSKANSRALARGMQSAYNLLPSQKYLSQVIDPVIVFDNTVSLTLNWRNQWGLALGDFVEFFQFLTGDVLGVPVRSRPVYNDTQSPEVLRSDLLTNADAFHTQFDDYVFPASMRVVQIAGWGLSTIKGIEYTQSHGVLDYEPRFTVEGDKNVVYPSALSVNTPDSYFFNLFDYNKLKPAAEHRNIIGATPVLELLEEVLEERPLSEGNFLSKVKPNLAVITDKLLVGVHSPVTLGAYDSQGRFTGVTSGQDPASGVQFITEDIPGSQYLTFGEGKYILLPEGDVYTFAFQGTGSGLATVSVQEITQDTQSDVATYADIPVSIATKATFVVVPDVAQSDSIHIDQNGDGVVDTYVAPDLGSLSVDQLLINLTTAVQNLTIKDKLRTQLSNKITSLQKKVDKQKQKQSNVLAKLQTQVQKQSGKGKIDSASATQISTLVEDLISQSTTIPLDPVLINQLKEQINTLSITTSLKNSLLAKVTQLQNLAGVTKSLGSLTVIVTKKGTKGQIPDADVQNMLNLLEQIQNAI